MGSEAKQDQPQRLPHLCLWRESLRAAPKQQSPMFLAGFDGRNLFHGHTSPQPIMPTPGLAKTPEANKAALQHEICACLSGPGEHWESATHAALRVQDVPSGRIRILSRCSCAPQAFEYLASCWVFWVFSVTLPSQSSQRSSGPLKHACCNMALLASFHA